MANIPLLNVLKVKGTVRPLCSRFVFGSKIIFLSSSILLALPHLTGRITTEFAEMVFYFFPDTYPHGLVAYCRNSIISNFWLCVFKVLL